MIPLFWYIFITLLVILVWGIIVLTNDDLPPTIPSERSFVLVIILWPYVIPLLIFMAFFFVFKWIITGKKI